jgi:hypothetical protein
LSDDAAQLRLKREIADTSETIAGQPWATDDPPGIRSLLCDAYRVCQLSVLIENSFDISEILVTSVTHSLAAYTRRTDPRLPAEHRLAFRELGLSIGLHAVPMMQRLAADHPPLFSGSLRATIADLQRYARMATAIETFWRDPRSQRASTWLEHRDINRVMLATSLLPDEFLAIGPAQRTFQ